MKQEPAKKIEALQSDIAVLTQYMVKKIDCADWHAVADAAMDIRELVSKIEVYSELIE